MKVKCRMPNSALRMRFAIVMLNEAIVMLSEAKHLRCVARPFASLRVTASQQL